MTLQQTIKRALRRCIAENYGADEAEEPCYDIKLLADAIAEAVSKRLVGYGKAFDSQQKGETP